jgi:hypothetical protein
MPRKGLERLIGKAVLDPEFREKLFADPRQAIREVGLDLSEEEIAALETVDPEKAKAAIEEMSSLAAQPWK